MAISKIERLEILEKRGETIEDRMSSIKTPTTYKFIDAQILEAIIGVITEFKYHPEDCPKLMNEHLDYLENCLEIFINDLNSGAYGEENTS